MNWPETMKAAILVEQNKPLVLAEVELPKELAYGQVLVKVLYSGICGSQLGEIAGVKGPDAWLPHLLGHEGSGQVVAVGEGVSTVAKGDTVVMHWLEGAGICGPPPKYSWNGQTVNAGFVTTFNEYAIVSENRVTTIPAAFPARLAPLFGCAVPTGLGVMDNKAQVRIGESAVVFGAGGVGLNVIQGASLKSAYPVIAVDLVDARLELAKRFGATHTVNSSKEDAEARIAEILGTGGADVVVDNTGNVRVIELAYRLTAPQGKTLLVGVPRKGDEVSLYTLPLHFGKQLTGTKGGEGKPQVDIPRYVRLHDAGKLELAPLITEEFSLDEINTAMDRMRSGEAAGRVLISMNHS